MIHSSLSAMRGIMARQTVIANNMANSATTGFRAELVNAKARHLDGPTLASRAINDEQVLSADLSPGAVTRTGRPLDIALQKDAMLTVQDPDGEPAYTRRGDLMLSESGLVTTGAGDPVMGDGGPLILPPAGRVEIARNGTIWIAPEGGGADDRVEAGRLALVSHSGSTIIKGADNLFRARDGGVLPGDPEARLTPGALEGSNVNMTASLIDMIEAGRAWETQVKLLSTAREIDDSGARLMQLPGA